MAIVVLDDSNLTNIATAIRGQTGGTDTYKPNQMAAAISAIKPTETFNITPNTTQQTVTPTAGHVFSGGTVGAILTEEKSTTVNGVITPTQGSYITSVTVNVPQAIPEEISTVTGMEEVLIDANIGKAYKYVGTTGIYTNGDIYVVE